MAFKVYSPGMVLNPIREDRFARNGCMPSPIALHRVARSLNYVAGGLQREVFGWYQPPGVGTDTPGSAAENTTRFIFRTTENVKTVRAYFGMAPGGASATSPAGVVFGIYDTGGSLVASKTAYYATTHPTGDYSNDEIHWCYLDIETGDGIAANTVYLGRVRSEDYARIHSITVVEIGEDTLDSSVTGVCSPLNWQALKDINNKAVQDLLQAGTKLWQHNATGLFSWGMRAATPIAATGTNQNIADTSYSAFNAAAPGFRVNTTYHGTHSGIVPLEFGVYAAQTGGTGNLEVNFELSGSTLYQMVINNGAGTINTAQTTHAAINEKIDVLVQTTGGSTWDVHAVSAWEYET